MYVSMWKIPFSGTDHSKNISKNPNKYTKNQSTAYMNNISHKSNFMKFEYNSMIGSTIPNFHTAFKIARNIYFLFKNFCR